MTIGEIDVKCSKLPKIVFLVGIDGAGKTIYAKMILKFLQEKGIISKHVWSRNNNYLSKPLLALTLLIGLNYKEYHDGITFQYYEYWRSKFIKKIYIWLQIIDVNIATYLKIYRQSQKTGLIVCDRGPYDTIADVMLGTGEDLLVQGYFDKFIRILPKEHVVIHLHRPIKEIIRSRPELKNDKSLFRKNELYKKMQRYFGWQRINNTNSPEVVLSKILSCLNEHWTTP
jgi:thymidylate kinase